MTYLPDYEHQESNLLGPCHLLLHLHGDGLHHLDNQTLLQMSYFTLEIKEGMLLEDRDASRKIKVTTGDGRDHEVFFPKSQCRMKTNTQMEIPEWLLSNIESKLGSQIVGIK
jgi:hypothetical protein